MRTLLVLVLFIILFIGFSPLLLVLSVLRKYKPEAVRAFSFHFVQAFLHIVLFVSGTNVIVDGRENIPDDEAVLFVGNHRSYFDVVIAFANMKHPTGFIGKKELNSFPFLNWWMVLIECLFLDRQNAREGIKTIKAAIAKINEGISIGIFPEGTRNRNEDKDVPMEFKDGSLKIAQKTGCKIIPMAIKDTERVFEEQFPWIRKRTVWIEFCKPVKMDEIPEEYKKNPASYLRQIIMDVNLAKQKSL